MKNFVIWGSLLLPFFLQAQISHSRIAPLLEKGEIPGMSLAFIQDTTITAVTFGYKDRDAKELVGPNTVFQAASLSKPVVALLALKLHEKRKLDLDQPLWRLVTYPKINQIRYAKKITPRMVLSHTSGLPNWSGTSINLSREPGSSWSYSGEAFVWLSKVIEQVLDQPFEEAVKEEIFQPLNMQHSSFVWDNSFEEDYAAAYDEIGVNTSYKKFLNPNAAASLWTTASDYARFLRAILQQQLIRPESWRLLLSPQAEVPESGNALQWSLGWGIQKVDEKPVYWHWGDNRVFRSFTAFDLKEKKAFVYFSNSENGLSVLEELGSLFGQRLAPIADWLDYPLFDDPVVIYRKKLKKALYEEQVKEAGELYRQINLEYPKLIDANWMDGIAYSLKEYGKGNLLIPFFEAFLQKYSTDIFALEKLAELYTLNHQFKKAKVTFEKAMRLNADASSKYLLRIKWLEEGIRADESNERPDFLMTFTGKYDKYSIQLIQQQLYLNNTETGEKTKLLPKTKYIFELDAQVKYRLKFEWTNRTKIEGFTLHGIEGRITYFPKE